jgi:hypothetical protein
LFESVLAAEGAVAAAVVLLAVDVDLGLAITFAELYWQIITHAGYFQLLILPCMELIRPISM